MDSVFCIFVSSVKFNSIEVSSQDFGDNAEKIIEIYKGKLNEFSQSVALNVAAGLIVSGKDNNLKDAFEKATKHLSSGKVFQHLSQIQSS